MTGTVEGPGRGVLLAAVLAAGCGGGEATSPDPPPAAVATAPSSAPEVLRRAAAPPALEEEDPPEPPALPYPAPGEDPDFPAKAPPGPGDWLARFHEAGQTAEEYRASCRNRMLGIRRRIVVQPLGRIAGEKAAAMASVRGFLAVFFDGAEVEVADPVPLDAEAFDAERGQYLAPAILAGLGNGLRGSDLARLALCLEDLRTPELNFVFGLASPRLRTGVFSLHRYGGGGEALFRLRALKVAAHETGHLLGLEHCVRYECLMNGSNSLPETDRTPLFECPECREKLRWNLGFDPAARWGRLAAFLEREGLREEAAFAAARAAKSRSR